MIDIGVASPSAQGQAMIRTVTATMSAWASRGSGPTVRPDEERDDGDDDDRGHEPGRDPVGHAAGSARGSAAPRRPSATIRASIVSRPIFSARMTSEPVWFIVPPMTVSPAVLVTGIDSPVTSDSSSDGAAVLDRPVDRDRLAGADPEPVADLDQVEGDLVLGAVRGDAGARSWG